MFLGMHTALHMCMAFFIPKNVPAFQSPWWTSHSVDLPFKFLARSYFAQLVWQPQATMMLNNCHWLFSANALRIGLFWQSNLQVRSNDDCKHGFSRKLRVRSGSDIDLEMGVFGKFKIKSVPSSGCKAAGFQGSYGTWERTVAVGQVKRAQNPGSYWGSTVFLK